MYQIKNENEIYLFDYIEEGLTACQVMESLYKEGTEPAVIHINSSGGDVFEGIALYNFLKPRNVTVYIDGICASAASIIAMSGHVVMPRNALMMIHNPIGYTYGDSEEMRKQGEILDKIRDSLVMIYAEKTGLESEKIIGMMKSETWMSGAEAKSLGFADEVTGEIVNQKTLTYEDGVKAERERLKALDELMSPGREAVIQRAKYQDIRTANDIAFELLRARPSDMAEVIYANTPRAMETGNKVAEIINRMRGYK